MRGGLRKWSRRSVHSFFWGMVARAGRLFVVNFDDGRTMGSPVWRLGLLSMWICGFLASAFARWSALLWRRAMCLPYTSRLQSLVVCRAFEFESGLKWRHCWVVFVLLQWAGTPISVTAGFHVFAATFWFRSISFHFRLHLANHILYIYTNHSPSSSLRYCIAVEWPPSFVSSGMVLSTVHLL